MDGNRYIGFKFKHVTDNTLIYTIEEGDSPNMLKITWPSRNSIHRQGELKCSITEADECFRDGLWIKIGRKNYKKKLWIQNH